MSQSVTQTGLDRLHAAMAGRVERGEFPGLVTLIAQGDDVHVDAIGMKAFGGSEPMTRADAVSDCLDDQAGDRGRHLDVDRGRQAASAAIRSTPGCPSLPIGKCCNGLNGPLDETVPAHRSITVDDLLTFRLGFGHITEPTFDPPFPIVIMPNEMKLVLGAPDPRTPHAPDEWMRLFGTLPLMEQPGERWRYNIGSLILGVLIARVTGRDLGDVLRTRIFDPLGMHHTGFYLPIEETRALPSYYMTNFQIGSTRAANALRTRGVVAPARLSLGRGRSALDGRRLSTVRAHAARGWSGPAVA